MKEEKARSRTKKQERSGDRKRLLSVVEEIAASGRTTLWKQAVDDGRIFTVRKDTLLEQAVMLEENTYVKETAGQDKKRTRKKR